MQAFIHTRQARQRRFKRFPDVTLVLGIVSNVVPFSRYYSYSFFIWSSEHVLVKEERPRRTASEAEARTLCRYFVRAPSLENKVEVSVAGLWLSAIWAWALLFRVRCRRLVLTSGAELLPGEPAVDECIIQPKGDAFSRRGGRGQMFRRRCCRRRSLPVTLEIC